jgi:hypothetical protein
MTHSVTGVVDNAFTKNKTSRAGKDFTVNYVTVGGVTYSTGFDAVHTTGQTVNVAVKWNYGEWQFMQGQDNTGMPACTGDKPFTASPTGASFKGGSRGKFPIDTTDGQMSIIRQSSLNRAVDLVANMISTGVVSTPSNHSKYMKLVIEIALICTDFGSGQDIMQLKAAMAANERAANG